MTFSKSETEILSRVLMREGTPRKNQMWETGVASSMWPMRSRRTMERVTSKPHIAQIIKQNIEGSGGVRRFYGFILDDGIKSLGAPQDIVRFYGQHFSQSISRAVAFQGPDFHFSESLSPALSLAA